MMAFKIELRFTLRAKNSNGKYAYGTQSRHWDFSSSNIRLEYSSRIYQYGTRVLTAESVSSNTLTVTPNPPGVHVRESRDSEEIRCYFEGIMCY